MHSNILSDTEVPLKSVLVSFCDIYEHLFWQHAWVWLFWLLSQAWISLHIWKPNVDRLMSTEILFCMPGYESLFVDQSLALNRRHDKGKKVSTEVKKGPEIATSINIHVPSSLSWIIMSGLLFILVDSIICLPCLLDLFLLILAHVHTSVFCPIIPLFPYYYYYYYYSSN